MEFFANASLLIHPTGSRISQLTVSYHNFVGYAGVAQLVEQLICNQPVAGSNPVSSSIYVRN